MKTEPPRITLSTPNLAGNEQRYLLSCIDENQISSVGSFVTRFEAEFARYVGVKNAVATVNGTSALHLALLILGVLSGDEVVVPNLTFIATVNAVKYAGAQPVLIDSEWPTLGMDPLKLQQTLEASYERRDGACYNRRTGRCLRAIIVMHTLGHPAKIKALNQIAQSWNIRTVEDAAESLGSYVDGQHTGTFSEVGIFSFNGNKIISCGGGGMLIARDPALSQRAKHLSTTAKTDSLFFDHDEVGYNYRLVNVLAALGVAQLEQLPGFLASKRKVAKKYQASFSNDPDATFFIAPESVESNYWLNAMLLSKTLAPSRDRIIKKLDELGIECRPLWRLMKDLPMYAECEHSDLSTSEEIYERTICVPSSTHLSEPQQERVIDSIKKVLRSL